MHSRGESTSIAAASRSASDGRVQRCRSCSHTEHACIHTYIHTYICKFSQLHKHCRQLCMDIALTWTWETMCWLGESVLLCIPSQHIVLQDLHPGPRTRRLLHDPLQVAIEIRQHEKKSHQSDHITVPDTHTHTHTHTPSFHSMLSLYLSL